MQKNGISFQEWQKQGKKDGRTERKRVSPVAEFGLAAVGLGCESRRRFITALLRRKDDGVLELQPDRLLTEPMETKCCRRTRERLNFHMTPTHMGPLLVSAHKGNVTFWIRIEGTGREQVV